MKKIILLIVVVAIAWFVWGSNKVVPVSVGDLVGDLMADKDVPSNGVYKTFETLESPSKKYVATLFGTGVFDTAIGILITEGSIMKKAYVTPDNWDNLSLTGLVWTDEDTVSYDQTTTVNGESKLEKRSLSVK